MGDITFDTAAYAKIILHAAKYPHCAVNGVLLADATKIKDGAKNQDLYIIDTMPLFHHSHYVSPMAEIALTQIETIAQSDNKVIAGYYAACEHFRDNTVEKCPGQKIAEKIAEYFPSAIFAVVDNTKMTQHPDSPALKLYKFSDGKWKLRDTNDIIFEVPYSLETVSHMLQGGVQRDLVDFDNWLDDQTLDWSNMGVEKLVASFNASNS